MVIIDLFLPLLQLDRIVYAAELRMNECQIPMPLLTWLSCFLPFLANFRLDFFFMPVTSVRLSVEQVISQLPLGRSSSRNDLGVGSS